MNETAQPILGCAVSLSKMLQFFLDFKQIYILWRIKNEFFENDLSFSE